jgi:uncharacterized protein (DUF1697 family)
MPRYIAFLRAINVGGHTVKMGRLKTLFEEIGLKDVSTFIASGNVIFLSPSRNSALLEKKIETHLRNALGYEVATFLRTDKELKEVAEHQPFEDAGNDYHAIYVAFLHSKPGKESVDRMMAFKSKINDFRVHQREMYWLCRKKMMDSEFSGAVLEKTLGMPATLRNTTTVAKLATILSSEAKS